ncbi:hypothetical protein K490DRAFT_62932 [Saccharata proteae CBS 121410]|uniref:Uncharacterized protein n=1 Tax=Saccharata proteae CBS 121410 TaxID=1314787 RepID=A0A9P4HYB4_9PEZI|nr:hypothetical protein K490DRAFT_62932 [Saccharata proteae CBS 121410]
MVLQEELASEISRVVSCQYAVSLKPLHTLLRRSDAFTIRRWAGGHPCQIPKLAAAVEEALQTWPYALEILRKLLQSKSFRDAFLDQHPTILQAFLGKATSAHCSEEVFDTCIAFLTEPLPTAIPLPASAQIFLVETFKRATRSPTEHSYALVFTLLDGACKDLVGVLPRDTWNQFQDYNWELLKRKDLENYTTVATLCFGISVPLTQPQSKRPEVSWSSSRGPTASNPATLASSEDHLTLPRLFGTDHGRSITRLMVGNALLWCGEDVTSFDDPTIRNMKIASQVVSLVPEEVRISWSRDHCLWIDKLLGKVLQPGIHPMLQLQALTIVGLLHQANNIPARAVAAYEKVLLAVVRLSPSLRMLAETLSISMGSYLPQLNASFTEQILRGAMLVCAQSSPQLDYAEALTLLLQHLSIAAMEDLEARCEEIEVPLRQEQEKVEKLRSRVDELEKENVELSAQASELESRDLDRELFTEGLENEKRHADDQIADLTASNQGLEERVEGLKRKLREANETADNTIVAVRKECDSRVSEIRAALASAEIISRDNETEVLGLKQRAADLEKALRSANEHLAHEKDAYNSLKKREGALETNLEQQNATVLQQQERLNEAALQNAALSQELGSLEQSTARQQAEHVATISSLRADIDLQRNSLQEELRCCKDEAIKTKALLDEQLSASKKNVEMLRSQHDHTCEELQVKERALSKLQQKVDKLSDAYNEKEAQVREAEAFKTRILSAMGPASGAFAQPEKVSRMRRTRHSVGLTSQTPGSSNLGARLADADEFGSLEVDEDASPNGSFGKTLESSGYSKGGPTPKRAKSHQQPFKVPSNKQMPNNMRSGMASQARPPSSAQRKPLLDVSVSRGNRSPDRGTSGAAHGTAKNILFDEKPAFLSPDQVADDVMDDDSFRDSDLFTSTPFVPQDYATSQPLAMDGDTTIDC